MSERSIEEIAARFEAANAKVGELCSVMPNTHAAALIASWRRRGEALAEIRDADPIEMALDPQWPSRIATAALKDKPFP